MPVSKNRKKKNVQSEIDNSLIHLVDKLMKCPECNNTREYQEFQELSIGYQTFWKNNKRFNQIDFYLVCNNCPNITAICKPF